MPSTYPTSLDTTTSLSTAVNSLTALLNGDHNAVTTTITVNSTAGAPSAGYAYIDSEVVRYTGTTGTTLTGCTRGADGTAAALHTNGALVKFALVADHHNSLVTAVIGLQNKVGLNTNGATATTMDGNKLAAGTVLNATLADSNVLFRKLKLENNVTRIKSAQSPAAIAITTGVWANAGTALSITPAVASYIMVWGSILGANNINTSDYARFQFNGGNGESGLVAMAARDDGTGRRSVFVFDTFLQSVQGVCTIQFQITADNNGTFTPDTTRSTAGSLVIFGIAIPST